MGRGKLVGKSLQKILIPGKTIDKWGAPEKSNKFEKWLKRGGKIELFLYEKGRILLYFDNFND